MYRKLMIIIIVVISTMLLSACERKSNYVQPKSSEDITVDPQTSINNATQTTDAKDQSLEIIIKEQTGTDQGVFSLGMHKDEVCRLIQERKMNIILDQDNGSSGSIISCNDIEFFFDTNGILKEIYVFDIQKYITSKGLKSGDKVDQMKKLYGSNFSSHIEQDNITIYQYELNSQYFNVAVDTDDNVVGWGTAFKELTVQESSENEKEYYFEPSASTIEGTLITRMYYGPPGFGEDPNNDAQENTFIMLLDSPIKVIAQEGDIFNSDITGVIEIQVDPINDEDTEILKQYINKRIKIQGTLFSALTGNDHTNVLIQVEKILD